MTVMDLQYKQIRITIDLFDDIMEHFSYHKEPFIIVAKITDSNIADIDMETTIKVNFPE